MKSELKAKFLQHLAAKKSDNAGFTLIELLVVIIIIGILSAIALPSFLNQANKAKQSEAKTYVGSMNRGQQAYFLENGGFTASIDELGVSIPTQTENYEYTLVVNNANTVTENVIVNGASRQPALRPYVGRVNLAQVQTTSEATTLAILCENDQPDGNDTTAVEAADPTFAAAAGTSPASLACANGTSAL